MINTTDVKVKFGVATEVLSFTEYCIAAENDIYRDDPYDANVYGDCIATLWQSKRALEEMLAETRYPFNASVTIEFPWPEDVLREYVNGFIDGMKAVFN